MCPDLLESAGRVCSLCDKKPYTQSLSCFIAVVVTAVTVTSQCVCVCLLRRAVTSEAGGCTQSDVENPQHESGNDTHGRVRPSRP